MNPKALLAVMQDRELFQTLVSDVASAPKKAKAVEECVREVPKNKRGEFWRSALEVVRNGAIENLETFHIGCILVNGWLNEHSDPKESIPPANVIDLVAECHDALFELHEHPKLQEEVMKICERWYVESRPGRERVVSQLVPSVILKSLQMEGNPSHVHNLRETLLLFDMDDESSLTLKKLLLQCFVSPAYLNSTQGRKFLAFVMTLSQELMLSAHESMKNQLLQLKSLKSDKRNTAVTNMARIYYSAWQLLRRAKNEDEDESQVKRLDMLEVFESEIVQRDYMNGAVMLADENLTKICLKVLNAAFHDNKKDRTVDSMLARMYEPVIWRGLGAVNATVRRNAAVVLFNAFPLHDPESRLEDISMNLQKQFDAVSALLNDPCGDVRATAVEGTCRILALFWETIPVQKSSKYLQQIVNELAHDRSSPLVRASVLKSMAYMLDFPLSQPALKLALPHLKRHLNDKSALVRTEMSRLLLKIDSTAGFKFNDMCSVSSVLVRLVADKDVPQVATILTELLTPSFFPLDVPSIEQLKRAKSLAMSHFEASQVFFSHLHRTVELNKVAKLCLLFASFVRARKRELENEDSSEAEINSGMDEIHIALSSVCTIWESIERSLKHGEDADAARQALEEGFSGQEMVAPLFEWTQFAERYETVLLRLCKLAPMDTKGQAGALERKVLRGIFLSDGSKVGEELEAKVALAVRWGMSERVIKELVRSLVIHLNKETDMKRKVEARAACRALSELVAVTAKVHNDDSEADEIGALKQNELLRTVFDLARNIVTGGDLTNEIASSLLVIETKLDVYYSVMSQNSDRRPTTLEMVIDWASSRIEELCESGATVVEEASRKRRKGANEIGDKKEKTTASLFELEDEEEEQTSLSNRGPSTLIDAMVQLAADAVLVGANIIDSCLYLIQAISSSSRFDQLLKSGLGRLIFALKINFEQDNRVDEMLRLAYLSAQSSSDVMDNILHTLMTRVASKHAFVRNILLRLFCDGEHRLLTKKPAAMSVALTLVIDVLVSMDQSQVGTDEELVMLIDFFARNCSAPKQAEVRKELIRGSKQARSRFVGDQLFNLAYEIDADKE